MYSTIATDALPDRLSHCPFLFLSFFYFFFIKNPSSLSFGILFVVVHVRKHFLLLFWPAEEDMVPFFSLHDGDGGWCI